MPSEWNESIFGLLNGLSGSSFTLDALIDLAIDNPVAKAGPIVACFAYAWWQADALNDQARRRSILLITLVSLFAIAPFMKVVSTGVFAPRPLVHSEQVYSVQADGELAASPLQQFRPPATGDAAARYESLQSGHLEENDFGSFPSDHAALFGALAFGIFCAARLAGLIALGWAVFVTLGARVITGLHWPLDIVIGAAVGIVLLIVALVLARQLPQRWFDWILGAADRWPGVAAAVLFLALLEISQAMSTLKRIAELGGSMAGAAV